MDSITHTVLGACLGEAVAGKKMGKKAMLFGILANNLPDADVITALWNTEAHSLLSHRGITHSILFAVVATFGMMLLFEKWFSKYQLTRKEWLLLIGSGLFLHILLDACTTYGTGWFEPFSSYRVSFNTLFILDPLLSMPILLGTLLLLIIKNSNLKARRIIFRTALTLSTLYLLITASIKIHVNSVVKNDLESKQMKFDSFYSTPAPMNNLLWYSYAVKDETFYTGYYSILDKQPTVDWTAYKRNDSLLFPYKQNSDVQDLIQFCKHHYYVSKKDSGIMIGDIRFGQLIGGDQQDPGFVFNFDIIPQADKSLKVSQSRFRDLSKDDLNRLMTRIKGI
ncbi:MAG: metal-dependent hydrolase [Bacteroidia bacterium]|nr:metal-dependent hydrolase [Bacteroidia bacterium]